MIEGNWRLVSGEQDGEEISSADIEDSTLQIVGDSHVVTVAGVVRKGTHTIDSGQNPATIDATDTEGPFAGQAFRGILKTEGDTFTVCFAAAASNRPTEFTTKNGQADILHVWKRDG